MNNKKEFHNLPPYLSDEDLRKEFTESITDVLNTYPDINPLMRGVLSISTAIRYLYRYSPSEQTAEDLTDIALKIGKMEGKLAQCGQCYEGEN